jgi:hypothetical protein
MRSTVPHTKFASVQQQHHKNHNNQQPNNKDENFKFKTS